MMMSSSLTIPVPNMITSSPSGGRFDFDDGGTYCGGWQDGKAHGHGVCTGPKNVGEYSGSWNFGFEMSGVYKWTNGAVYEGRWQNGKRHGVGVEYNGKWIYKGEWSQGSKGRYGVKASSNSAVKYEGTWANGLQDGYGSETYSDGGYYQGQMCRGLRHGYGVRKSAPYGDSQLNNPNKNGQITGTGLSSSMMIHSNSLQSTGSVDIEDDSPKPEDGFKPNIDRTLASKNGFVLVAKPLDVPMPSSSSSKYNGDTANGKSSGIRRNSLTTKLASARIPGSNQTASLLRGLRLRKQKSTSDLGAELGGASHSASGRGTSSSGSGLGGRDHADDLPMVPFTLSPEELDITDPTTVETYTGEWKHDKRNGHGVCERSDGLKYEGQWHNDMKCGYGVTTFKDGSKEEGKYKNNILIVDSKVKRFFQLGSTNIRQRIDDAVKMAQQSQSMALKKAEIADTRAATARDKADQATTAALEADRDSQIAFSVARQYSDSQQQQQQQLASANTQSSLLQAAGLNLGPPGVPNTSFGLTPMSLQMRRVSQQQQQLHRYAASNLQGYNQMSDMGNLQQHDLEMGQNVAGGGMRQMRMGMQEQQQQQQQQQYLGPVEPFNGRRGSFRGGSQPSSGYQSSFATHMNYSSNAPSASGASFVPASNRQSADPFNDLFDHYKSGPILPPNPSRRMLSKQTSLDYNQLDRRANLRQASPHETINDHSMSGNSRLRRFRMSSMDHAEENQTSHSAQDQALRHQQQQQHLFARDSLDTQLAGQQMDGNIQQQFKQLVTSSEDLQQQQQKQQSSSQRTGGQSAGSQRDSGTGEAGQLNAGTTPTDSLYVLPQSANSSLVFSNQTPSPDAQATFQAQNTNNGQQQQQFYGQQQQQQQQQAAAFSTTGYTQQRHDFQQNQQQQYPQHLIRQRDVHSLADEQLYLAGHRRIQDSMLIDKTAYTNYDFTISSEPSLSRRCMRRTASLSRNTPIKSSNINELRAHTSSIAGSTIHPLPSSAGLGFLRSISPAISIVGPSVSARSTTTSGQGDFQPHSQFRQHTVDANSSRQFHLQDNEFNLPNNIGYNSPGAPSNSSHLTLDSSSASSGLLIRKPSLQVRYDPDQLGGLMSREEVAALSHAQREQKRIEADLAEKRAKRPLLHLYLSLKEFLMHQRLILSVLLINVCLFKLFADLIV